MREWLLGRKALLGIACAQLHLPFLRGALPGRTSRCARPSPVFICRYLLSHSVRNQVSRIVCKSKKNRLACPLGLTTQSAVRCLRLFVCKSRKSGDRVWPRAAGASDRAPYRYRTPYIYSRTPTVYLLYSLCVACTRYGTLYIQYRVARGIISSV
jgi:hypothetical protein